MPQQILPTGQDWGTVDVGRGGGFANGAKSVPKNPRELALAKAAGLVATEKRYGAGGNKSAHSSAAAISTRKLEEATDAGTIAKVDKSLSLAIMQARTAKKLTQKDLATAINEKPQVVADYENGKAIPNPQIILKLEQKLGVKLPRSGKPKAAVKKVVATPLSSSSSSSGALGNKQNKLLTTPSAGKINALTRGGPAKRR